MRTNLDSHRAMLTVTINGDLISTATEQIKGQMDELFRSGAGADPAWKTFRLDLVAAKMVDSVGLNFVVSVLKTVSQRGAKMQVVCGNANVHRTFVFTRLDKHLELVLAQA